MNAIPFAFDVTNVDIFVAGGDPVPSGTYVAAIREMEVKANSKAESGHNLALQYVITEGQYKGRKVFENLNLWHKTSSAAADIAMKQLSSIGHAVGILKSGELTDLAHKPMLIDVDLAPATADTTNDNGTLIKGRGPSNNILAHNPVTPDALAAAQGHVPQVGAVSQQNTAQAQTAPTFNPGAQTQAPTTPPQTATANQNVQQTSAPNQTQAPAGAPDGQAVPPWLQK